MTTFAHILDAALTGLNALRLACPPTGKQGCSMACSHGRASAMAGTDIARHTVRTPHVLLQPLLNAGLVWYADRSAPREGLLVGQGPIETSKARAQPEGQKPGAAGTRPAVDASEDAAQKNPCARACSGCAGAAKAAAGARLRDGAAAVQAPGLHTPPSNTGVNKVSEVQHVG